MPLETTSIHFQGIMFLRSSPPAKQSFSIDDHPHLPDLVKILRTNKSDDSTMNWIKVVGCSLITIPMIT